MPEGYEALNMMDIRGMVYVLYYPAELAALIRMQSMCGAMFYMGDYIAPDTGV